MILDLTDAETDALLRELEPYLRAGKLRTILSNYPPIPFQLAALYPHKNLQDPKVRLLLDFMADRCQKLVRAALAP